MWARDLGLRMRWWKWIPATLWYAWCLLTAAAPMTLYPPTNADLSWSTELLDPERHFAAAYPGLLDDLVKAHGEPYSLWWTTGSDRVPPSLRSYPGLPPEESFATFLYVAQD